MHLIRQTGSALLEVMVTIAILSFGLLGVAGMQAKVYVLEQESYARSQALVLLNDIVEKIYANKANASGYVAPVTSPYGSGAASLAVCLLAHPAATDVCSWSEALKASQVSDNALVSLDSARGCITQVQAPDNIPGACKSGIYRIEVVWRGKSESFSPVGVACGSGLYGSETHRRSVATTIGIGVLECAPS